MDNQPANPQSSLPAGQSRGQHIPDNSQRRPVRMRSRRTVENQSDRTSRSLLPGLRGIVPRPNPSQSHLQRHRMRRQREHDGFGTVQEAVDDLENDQRSTRMTASALDQTLPVPAGADEFEGLQEHTDNAGRRNKRRKLGADPLDAIPKISYGFHGQVAPARLNMVISYNDGGHLHEDRQYSQENILKNDKSVYCSKKSKVNLMLSHLGEIPFTCTKIVIKTPDCGFPAPVQEGMVFVYMADNNVLEQTSRFQLQDWCTTIHPGATPPPENPRMRPRLHLPPGVWEVDPLEIVSRGDTLTVNRGGEPINLDHLAHLPLYGMEEFSESILQSSRPATSHSHDDLPPLARTSRRIPAPCGISAYENNIITTCDSQSSDDEDPTPEPVLEDRRRRARQADSDFEDEEDSLQYTSSNRSSRQRPFSRAILWTGKDPSSFSSSSSAATAEPKPPGADVPYIRFFIERKKHITSIKFNPPVSGKHVLLKLWSPHGKTSLDIQSVCVYGFAGPRFFPVLLTR